MQLATLRRLFGILLLIVSLALLGWGFAATQAETRSLSVGPQEMQLPGAPAAAIPENRTLEVLWPSRLRVGDAGVIRLSLEMAGQAAPGGDWADVYATHDVVAEARLEMAGVEYRPDGEVSQALQPGRPVMFQWSLRADQAGAYDGTVWLHLRFVPHDGGPEQRSVITAQRIEMQAGDFLGLSGALARVLGSTGAVVGLASSAEALAAWRRKKR